MTGSTEDRLMSVLRLPTSSGDLEPYQLGSFGTVSPVPGPWKNRQVYAAVHVVADPLGDPVGSNAIDWDATLAHRRHLWSLGFGVAEVMDTAQRGNGLSTDHVTELIRRTSEEAEACQGRAVYGVTTDQLQGPGHTLPAIVSAYEQQLEYVESVGGEAIVMPSRALASAARSSDDYRLAYDRLLSAAAGPVMLHWLGEAFDPELAGYWGHHDPWQAAETVLDIIAAAPGRVTGIKVSVLDSELEISLRRRLPPAVRCFTGDDFDFPRLIAGEDGFHSDALLGIFDAIAPVASAALDHLEQGDLPGFHSLLDPTVALSRHMFQAPTYHYKTGIVFLAYLTGHQDHFRMLAGHEGSRSIIHLAELLRLADRAGLIADPALAEHRFKPLLSLAGID